MVPELSQNGHVILRNFLDRRMAAFLYRLLLVREWRGEFKRDDHIPTALSFWGDSTLDTALVSMLPEMERATGCTLLPTYCYARLYSHGDRLGRHRDREACEISATIHLGSEGVAPPPICFEPAHAVYQEPGDGVVFLANRVAHWRDTFVGDNFGQLFLNYVRTDGPYRDHAFDRRIDVFPPAVLRSVNIVPSEAR